MIQEAYVSFETSKLLKEKGFDNDIDLWYDEKGDKFFKYHYDIKKDWRVRQNQQVYLCPTQQMAMRWLREVRDLNCQVMLDSWSEAYGSCGYYYMINQKNGGFREISPDDSIFFESYEDACEAAIKYCLTNLI